MVIMLFKQCRESGGWGESVTDEEILDGIKLLARTEGIFTEPAGGTEVAVTKKLIERAAFRATNRSSSASPAMAIRLWKPSHKASNSLIRSMPRCRILTSYFAGSSRKRKYRWPAESLDKESLPSLRLARRWSDGLF